LKHFQVCGPILPLFAAFCRFLPLFATYSEGPAGVARQRFPYDKHMAAILNVYGRYMADTKDETLQGYWDAHSVSDV
ncbi:MAG: hypothetical protein ABI760_21940, partial [Ferruginibacter sp.]